MDIGYVAMQIRKLEMSKSLLMRLHMFHGWNKWHFNFNGLVYSMLLLVTNSDYNAHSWTDKKATYVNNSKNLNGSPYDRLKQRWSLIKESFVTERRFLFFFFNESIKTCSNYFKENKRNAWFLKEKKLSLWFKKKSGIKEIQKKRIN